MWGLVGLGAGGFQVVEPPKNKFIITTTRSHNDAVVQQALDILKPDEILRVGGAGHKVRKMNNSPCTVVKMILFVFN